MSNGWVKLHRGLLEHGIFRDAEVLQVWMYLLLRASYREQKLAIGRQVIRLQPGQLLYGRKAVSDKLSMGEGKLRGIMEMLEQSGSIVVESTNRYSVVTIVNWMEYQQGEGAPEFPFDVDFFDDEPLSFEPEQCRGEYYSSAPKPEPTEHQLEMQSVSGFALDDDDDFMDFQPTENHIQEDNNKIKNNIKDNKIKKYKIKKREQKTELNNRTEEKNNNKKESEKNKKENKLKQEKNKKTQEHHYRQRAGLEVDGLDTACDRGASVAEVAIGGESVIKGESVPEGRRRICSVKDTLPEGWPAIPATAENCILLYGTDKVIPSPDSPWLNPDWNRVPPATVPDLPEQITFNDGFAEPEKGCAIVDCCASVPSCDDTFSDTHFSYADTLAACDDAELESYFMGEYEGVYDDDLLAPFTSEDIDAAMENSYQPRHEFAIEMRGPNEPLTSADLNQLEQLYLCAQNQAQLDASGEDKPSASEKTVREEPSELQQACAMFDELWELYPKQLGYHKVSAAQKLKLYRTGYDTVAKAVRNYKRKKRRIRKEFWMNGSTFFNGGFLDYLPEAGIA